MNTGTLIKSASRSSGTESDQQNNYYKARGTLLILNVTAVEGEAAVTLKLETICNELKEFVPLWRANTAVDSPGTYLYLLYPGGSGGEVTEAASVPLPRRWRVSTTHDNTDKISYSVSYSELN